MHQLHLAVLFFVVLAGDEAGFLSDAHCEAAHHYLWCERCSFYAIICINDIIIIENKCTEHEWLRRSRNWPTHSNLNYQ